MRRCVSSILLISFGLNLLSALLCLLIGPAYNPLRTLDLPSLIRRPDVGMMGSNVYAFAWPGGAGVLWSRGWYARRFPPEQGASLTLTEKKYLRRVVSGWGGTESLFALHYYNAPTSADYLFGWPYPFLYAAVAVHPTQESDPAKVWAAGWRSKPATLVRSLTIVTRRLPFAWGYWVALTSIVVLPLTYLISIRRITSSTPQHPLPDP